MNHEKQKIAYVVADLKRIGPTNQTLNIIRYSGAIENCVVITLFDESADTQIQEYSDCGIKVVCLHLKRKFALMTGASALRKELEKQRPAIVHSWGTFADILSYRATKAIGVKHVITLRNFPVEEMTTRMNYAVGMAVAHLDLYILKRCRHVVCCSYAIKKKMEEAYGWKHLACIQNGVDLTKFRCFDKAEMRKKLLFAPDDFIYIATGSIIPRKRIDETADAFMMSGFSQNTKLIFLGEGNLLDGLREKYKGCPNIRFLGKKNNVAEYLSAADVFVSSSESEGMPNAVLEALACGLPVYLSDIPQHTEVLQSVPGCGESYPLGQRELLSKLLRNTTHSSVQAMRLCGKKIYESDLTMTEMGKKYAEFYECI